MAAVASDPLRRVRAFPRRPLAAMIVALLPTMLLVARTAIGLQQFRTQLLALGFHLRRDADRGTVSADRPCAA